MNISLTGKHALVTGGNSGIGAEIARELAAAGAKVAINYVSHPEAADELVKKIEANGGEAIAIQADVADAQAIASLFQQIDSAWDGINILVWLKCRATMRCPVDGNHIDRRSIQAEATKVCLE